MGGFSAITGANGWLIAALGISVVFFGLASLAFIVSCFPRMLEWWNGQSPRRLMPLLVSLFKGRERKAVSPILSEYSLETGDLDDAEEALRLLTAHMGEPFKLPRLIELAEHRGLARPHSTINRLLLRNRMVGTGEGLFRWAKGSEQKRSSQHDET